MIEFIKKHKMVFYVMVGIPISLMTYANSLSFQKNVDVVLNAIIIFMAFVYGLVVARIANHFNQ